MAKNLIIYYSRKGENYFGGSIRSIDKGNTEIVAEYIQKKKFKESIKNLDILISQQM